MSRRAGNNPTRLTAGLAARLLNQMIMRETILKNQFDENPGPPGAILIFVIGLALCSSTPSGTKCHPGLNPISDTNIIGYMIHYGSTNSTNYISQADAGSNTWFYRDRVAGRPDEYFCGGGL